LVVGPHLFLRASFALPPLGLEVVLQEYDVIRLLP
jgi:hypothetical protein